VKALETALRTHHEGDLDEDARKLIARAVWNSKKHLSASTYLPSSITLHMGIGSSASRWTYGDTAYGVM